MTLLRKLASETAIYGFSYILSRILHYLVFTWYLTRVFNDDVSQYGIYRDLYFYVAVLLVILTFRMETTYFRYAKEDRSAVTTMSMGFLAVIGGLFVLGLWLYRGDVVQWLEYPAMRTHVMMLGGVLFLDTMSAVPFASLRQQNRPLKFLFLKLGSILLNIVFVLFFLEIYPSLLKGMDWLPEFTSNDKLYYIILSNLLASLITFICLLPLLKWQTFRWDWKFFKRMLWYAWPLVIVAFAGVINQYSSIAFQKYFLPADTITNLEDGGIYAAAASLAIILSLFTTAFNYAAEPFFFAHKDRADAKKIYAEVAMAFTLIGSIMMLVILGYIDLFQLLLGSNFREGLEVVPILLVSFLLLGIYYNVSAWYKLADKTLWGAWIAIGGTIITVVLSMRLLPTMGVMGSAWTALACYSFMVATCYLLGQKFYPIPYPIFRMIAWIVGALGIYFLMEWLRGFYEDKFILVLVINTILISLYATLIYFMERPLWNQLLTKPKK